MHYCYGKIQIGEKYQYSAMVDGGDFWTFKAHLDCKALTNELNMWRDYDIYNGLTSDDFQAHVQEKFLQLKGEDMEETTAFAEQLEYVKKQVLTEKIEQ